MVETERLTKTYHRGRNDDLPAVADVSLRIAAGETVVFKGPSGSGKTTLLSLIGCMTRPTSGRVMVAGRDVSRLPENFLTEIRRRTFGFIFQQFHLISGLSLLDNVLAPLHPLGLPRREMERLADAALARLDLSGRRRHRPAELSGGEQQRVAIARALVNQPELLIADEPTAHLDAALTASLLQLLGEIRQEGKTILIATHDPRVYQHALVDRVVEMRDGRVL